MTSMERIEKIIKEEDVYIIGTGSGCYGRNKSAGSQDREYSDKEKKVDDSKIEKWISSIIQTEHLSLLVGNGLSMSAVAEGSDSAKKHTTPMNFNGWNKSLYKSKAVNKLAKEIANRRLSDHPANSAKLKPNLEDYLIATNQVLAGFKIAAPDEYENWEKAVEREITKLRRGILKIERSIASKENINSLVRFVIGLASRPPSKDRLNIFTTNYDRLIEYACDKVGIRIIDRFVGSVKPRFNATRLNTDMHYSPPGINNTPSYLPGVVRLSKIHGSIDWAWEMSRKAIIKSSLEFGGTVLKESNKEVIIYPRSSKDLDATNYPYSELFRDFAASLCRPNSTLVIYGYNFGDEHINRIITDMLNIQSTHLLIFHYSGVNERVNLKNFLNSISYAHPGQVSLLVGKKIAGLKNVTTKLLPQFELYETLKRQHDTEVSIEKSDKERPDMVKGVEDSRKPPDDSEKGNSINPSRSK